VVMWVCRTGSRASNIAAARGDLIDHFVALALRASREDKELASTGSSRLAPNGKRV
jgi:hypothetical protein